MLSQSAASNGVVSIKAPEADPDQEKKNLHGVFIICLMNQRTIDRHPMSSTAKAKFNLPQARTRRRADGEL